MFRNYKLTTILSIIIFITTFSILSIYGYINETDNYEQNITKINLAHQKKLNQVKEIISTNLSMIKTEVSNTANLIANSSKNKLDRSEISNIMSITFSSKYNMFQSRLIDADGNELIRYNLSKDGKFLEKREKEKKLQKKQHRYYVKEGFEAPYAKVTFSKLDLNMENNKIEIPYKSTLRASIKIKIASQDYLLIINYDLNQMLKTTLYSSLYDILIIESDKQINFHLKEEYIFSKQLNKDITISDLYSKEYDPNHKDFNSNHYHTTPLGVRDYALAIATKMSIIQDLKDAKIYNIEKMILIGTLISLIISTILYLILSRILKRVSMHIEHIVSGKSIDEEEEREYLEFKHILKNARETYGRFKLQDIEKTDKLNKLNTNLNNKIKKALEENTKQLYMMQQQSKMAAMGEMIGAIAHQWRQPLSTISTAIQNLEFDYEDGFLKDEKYVLDFIEKEKKTIGFMSKTIDDFRDFFKVDKHKKEFGVLDATDAVVEMQSAQLKSNFIKIDISGEEFSYFGFKSEYQQVILNLISNAKDAMVENGIKYSYISIVVEKNKVLVKDNAGGIPKDVIERVFEPYFTTKEQGKGTGMGLYMSKMIIEDNMGCKIGVVNEDDGALFSIDFS